MLIKPGKKKFWTPGIAPYYAAAGGGAPPSFVYTDAQGGGGGGSSTLSATLNIGADVPNRRVYVLFSQNDSNNNSLASSSIGGVTCDVAVTVGIDSNSNRYYALSAIGVTGTSALASVTFGGTVFNGGVFAAYTVDTTALLSTTPVTSLAPSAAFPVTGTIATQANGAVLAWSNPFGGNHGSGSFTTPNDPPVSFDIDTGGFGAVFGHANSVSANAASQVTITASLTSGVTASLALAALR